MKTLLKIVLPLLVVLSATYFSGCSRYFRATTNENIVALPLTPEPSPVKTPTTLDLNGIDVGTSPDEVVTKLGKPISIKRNGGNPCGGRKLTYHYQGLVIDFDPNDETEKTFIVVGLQITKGDWAVGPGVKLGISEADLAERLGASNLTKEGANVLTYGLAEGSAYFHFSSGKLSRIEWAMNLC